MISGLIEGDDWRSDWTDKDYSEDLKKLDDPTPEHQRQQWNKETVRNHELKLETNNSEDIYGYYAIFDDDLSKTPHNSDVGACYKTQGSQYCQKGPFCITQIRIRIKMPRKRLTLINSIGKQKKLWIK